MSGKPKGDGPDTVDRLTRGLAAMKVDDDIDNSTATDIDNSRDTYHRIDYFAQGGAGASKTPCKTPGSFGDRRMKPSEETLMQAGRIFDHRMTNEAITRKAMDRMNDTPGGYGRPNAISTKSKRSVREDLTSKLALSAAANKPGPSGSLSPGDGSELRQVVEERDAGGNSDVHTLAGRMAAAKRASRGARKLLGSELGQPKVW